MKKFSRSLTRIQKKINRLSEQAFLPKYLPITIGVTVLLVGFYGLIFFQWMTGFSEPFVEREATLEIQQTTSPEDSQQQLQFTTNVEQSLHRNITGVQLVAIIEGDVPDDIRFVPAEIDGLQPLIATIEQEGKDHVLKVVFLTVPPSTYQINTPAITLGTLEFTRPEHGKVQLRFNPHLAKIIEDSTLKNILTTPRLMTYSF